jgi:hypothetical protein
MAFTIPENLHPDLMPLAWLVGTWRGKGRGEYPTISPFHHSEVGFWRIKDKKVLEVVLAHNSGVAEGWVGLVQGAKIQLEMDQGYSSPTAKIVTAGSRLYGLVEGELFTSYDMAAQGQTLQAHLWSSLERQSEN